jgi:geranylgeranyl diphosphate synthase type II
MADVKQQLTAYAQRVEGAMLAKLGAMEQEVSDMAMDHLFGAMRHSLTAGGKRIRPAMVYAFCEACGGETGTADTAACAMEMSHTASLIFDDLPALDNDDLRRGKPSCHKAFGESTAILAGLALVNAAYQFMAEDTALTDPQKAQLCAILSRREGAVGMVGGELKDMDYETQENVTLEEIEKMCLAKTGAFMASSCEMGVICGGGTPEQLAAAREYGYAVGLAFQIIDDILDVTSTDEMLGKPVGSDEAEGKTTFVTLMGIGDAKERAAELTAKAHECLAAFPHTEFLSALTDALLVRVQ